MQVAGDAVPVGLHLEAALPLLRPGQFQDDRRAGGEGGHQLQVVGVERRRTPTAERDEQPAFRPLPRGTIMAGP